MCATRVVLFLLFAGVALASYSTTQPRLDPTRVLILYDGTYSGDEDQNGVQDSLQLAQYYAQARSVPMANLLEINYTNEYPTFADVKLVLLQPVIDKLNSVGPDTIDVMAVMWPLPYRASENSLGRDDVGIDTVLMRPFKFYSGDATIVAAANANFRNSEKNPFFHPNPTYSADFPRFDRADPVLGPTLDKFYLVSRVDGPYGLYEKMNLISNAIYAEKYIDRDNFWGNVYIDTRGIKSDLAEIRTMPVVMSGECYGYSDGDGCIASVVTLLQNLSLPYKWNPVGPMIGQADSFWEDGTPSVTAPKALFYSGWYLYNFYIDVFDWLPGSYACDLNSVSFGTVRIPRLATHSAPKQLEAGVTCVSGAVGEPYVEAHPRGSTVIYYLLRGYSFAEAASLSTVYLGWNSLHVGDPLYQPLAAKEAAIDNEAPQIESFTIQHNPHEGHWVDLVLSGIETAKMTFKYGILSVEEHSLTSKFPKKFHKEYIGELQSGTQYYYQAVLVDPKGNTVTSSVGTFETPERMPYMNQTNNLPGRLECVYFDQGGDGIGSFSRVTKPGFHWSRPDSAIDTRIHDLATYYMRHQDWMKYTVNISTSGIYAVTWTMVLPGSNEFNVTFYLDGQQIGDPSTIPARTDTSVVTINLNDVTLVEGEHILKLRLFSTVYNATVETVPQTDTMKYLEFTLKSILEDSEAPTITKLYSEETEFYFAEDVAFADDLHVQYVEIWINGDLKGTYRELTADGVMNFHIPKTELRLGSNEVKFKAFDSFQRQAEQIFSYYLSEITVPNGSIITPDGTIISPNGVKQQPPATSGAQQLIGLALVSLVLALFVF